MKSVVGALLILVFTASCVMGCGTSASNEATDLGPLEQQDPPQAYPEKDQYGRLYYSKCVKDNFLYLPDLSEAIGRKKALPQDDSACLDSLSLMQSDKFAPLGTELRLFMSSTLGFLHSLGSYQSTKGNCFLDPNTNKVKGAYFIGDLLVEGDCVPPRANDSSLDILQLTHPSVVFPDGGLLLPSVVFLHEAIWRAPTTEADKQRLTRRLATSLRGYLNANIGAVIYPHASVVPMALWPEKTESLQHSVAANPQALYNLLDALHVILSPCSYIDGDRIIQSGLDPQCMPALLQALTFYDTKAKVSPDLLLHLSAGLRFPRSGPPASGITLPVQNPSALLIGSAPAATLCDALSALMTLRELQGRGHLSTSSYNHLLSFTNASFYDNAVEVRDATGYVNGLKVAKVWKNIALLLASAQSSDRVFEISLRLKTAGSPFSIKNQLIHLADIYNLTFSYEE